MLASLDTLKAVLVAQRLVINKLAATMCANEDNDDVYFAAERQYHAVHAMQRNIARKATEAGGSYVEIMAAMGGRA